MIINHLSKVYHTHKAAFLFALLNSILLLFLSWNYGHFTKTVVYLLVLVMCFIISEWVFIYRKRSLKNNAIKNVKQELQFILGCQVISIVLMIYYFGFVSPSEVGKSQMIILWVLRLLFVFPVALLIYFIGIKKYKLRELGIHFKNWFVALPSILIFGIVSFTLFANDLQFMDIVENYGIFAFITLGFFTAAIPEEIMRNLLQSRLSAISTNTAGWIIASLIWAFRHIPSFGSQYGDYLQATYSAIGILPLGLFWGYLNQRYKSIIPSILIHGTNLWGLQNLF